MLKAWNSRNMPLPYNRIADYIRLSGGSCINTGVALTDGFTYEIEIKLDDVEDCNAVFSTFAPEQDSDSYLHCRYWKYFGSVCVFNSGWIIPNQSEEYLRRIRIYHTVGRKEYFIGSQTVMAEKDDKISGTYPLLIGIRRQSESLVVGKEYENFGKEIYGVKIWDPSSALILDLIPVELLDGNGGMYDKVSGTVFENGTSGGAGSIVAY